jgi:hypothetical protein
MSIAASSLRVRFPVEYSTANPGRPAAACRRLSWTFLPFSTLRRGSPHSAGIPLTRCAPPAGFRYPHGDLLLPRPCRPFFVPAALVGFTLRSVPLSKGRPRRSRRNWPACRFSRRYRRRLHADPFRRAAAPGLSPDRESLANGRVISAPPAGCSLGVRSLPGLSRNSLERDSSRPPLARFSEPRTNALFGGVSECQSALAWSFPDMPEHRQLRIRQPS